MPSSARGHAATGSTLEAGAACTTLPRPKPIRRASADADCATPTQQIPLHFAARAGAEEPFLSHLLLATREPGARDVAGRTALHYVALAGGAATEGPIPGIGDAGAALLPEETQLQVAKLLLRFGAVDARDPDAQQHTAADLAEVRGRQALANLLRSAEAPSSCPGGRWAMPSLLCLSLGAAHACCLLFVLPLVTPGWPAVVLWTTLGCTACAGFAAGTRDPGYLVSTLPQGRPAPGVDPATFCHSCRLVKLLRSKHCRSCNKCVRDFDHHCPWLNNCIGRANRASFYVFVTALLLDAAALTALSLSSAVRAHGNAAVADGWICGAMGAICSHCSAHRGLGHALRWALFACSAFFSLQIVRPSPDSSLIALDLTPHCTARSPDALAPPLRRCSASPRYAPHLWQGAFWYFRTRNLLKNVTTNERHNHHRYAHFKSVDGAFHNPFDRGMRANCTAYFCLRSDGNSDVLPMLSDVTVNTTSSTQSQ
eukprot:1408706-Prymnesium_polylepis.2